MFMRHICNKQRPSNTHKHISLAFRGFELRGFANSWSRPINTNTISVGPFSGYEHQNCSTTRTGLRAIPHDVQRVDGGKKSSSLHNASATKRKTLTHTKTLPSFLGGGGVVKYSRILTFRVGLKTQPLLKARDERIFNLSPCLLVQSMYYSRLKYCHFDKYFYKLQGV